MPKTNRRAPVSIAFVAVGLLTGALPLLAQVPADRATTWNPGIPGGIPHRTQVCATVAAGGNIQAAINACPAGQVVQLGAGTWNLTSDLQIEKAITLRGQGPALTKLKAASGYNVITIGTKWFPKFTQSTNLAANGVKGSKTVTLASSRALTVGEIVTLDQLTNSSLSKWGYSNCQSASDACRGWFTRPNRPIGQVLEVASVSGANVTFVTPLHIDFLTTSGAQLSRIALDTGGSVIPVTKNAGVEDLYVSDLGPNHVWLWYPAGATYLGEG